MAIEINSDDRIPVDTSFKLKAGPGAGKTYWLINHIQNVVHYSPNLNTIGKIACLTYSNIGVDTILERLGHSKKVEVATIHSFLYSNIIKPYLNLIAFEEGFNMADFKGLIDDYVMEEFYTYKKVTQESKQTIQFKQWPKYVKNLRWKIKDQRLVCVSTSPIIKSNHAANDVYAKSTVGRIYKKYAWAQGILHYDDVNYFSIQILKKYRWIAKMLAISYPYIFIDEFQDTNPLQALIFKEIGKYSQTHIGIIGDIAQSIYGFQGASPIIFEKFTTDGMIEFEIKNNRRSLNPIVSFLNSLRDDLKQVAVRTEEGEPVKFLIGNKNQAFNYLNNTGLSFLSLSYTNVDSNSLRYQFFENREINKSMKFEDIEDSNHERKILLVNLIKAVENAKNNKFKFAFSLLERVNIKSDQAISIIKKFLSIKNLDQISLYEIVSELISFNIDITPISRGNSLEFYKNHKYGEFIQEVSIEDTDSMQRTIHKSKGDEANNVLLTTGKKFNPETLLDFKIMKEEFHRVYYVAMSRARDRLFIQFPQISKEHEKFFKEEWGIEIIYLCD